MTLPLIPPTNPFVRYNVPMRKLLFGLLIYLIIGLFITRAAYAANFSLTRHITYSLNEDLIVSAQEQNSIQNLTTEKYPTEFTLTLSQINLDNISAFDNQGRELQITQSTRWPYKQPLTDITIHFQTPVVGKNQTTKFTLTYDLTEAVISKGQTNHLKLPKILNYKNSNDISITLLIKQSLGHPAYINPSPLEQKGLPNNWYSYTIDPLAMQNHGLSAVFGDYQLYDFQLTYFLNSKLETGNSKLSSVTLPPDTDYQRIAITSIDPQPQNIILDPDQNWFALYSKSSRPIEITVTGTAMIFSSPWKTTLLKDPEPWLQPQPYWNTQNQEITELVENLSKPHPNLPLTGEGVSSPSSGGLEKGQNKSNMVAQNIYSYITQTLQYDHSKLTGKSQRQGAISALQNTGQAICTEFTDVFIALARAASIPSRQNIGYAHSDNPELRPLSLVADILHSWPEYYDSQQQIWKPIDPTWGQTSGLDYFNTWDFNHLTFVRNGLDSTYPLPAGFYKNPDDPQPDVLITAAEEYPQQNPQLKTELDLSFPYWPFGHQNINIKITNLGPTAAYDLETFYPEQSLHIKSQTNPDIVLLPPYGHQLIPLQIKPKPFTFNNQLNFQLNGQNITLKLPKTISIWQITVILLFTAFITASLVFSIIITRRQTSEDRRQK